MSAKCPLVKDNDLDNRGYFIYHAVGTNDAVKSQSLDMADEMLGRDIFTPDHYVFYQKDGGYHDFNAVTEYLFLRTHFLFLDPSEPLILFFIDYVAIMGLFVFIGHYLARLLRMALAEGKLKQQFLTQMPLKC